MLIIYINLIDYSSNIIIYYCLCLMITSILFITCTLFTFIYIIIIAHSTIIVIFIIIYHSFKVILISNLNYFKDFLKTLIVGKFNSNLIIDLMIISKSPFFNSILLCLDFLHFNHFFLKVNQINFTITEF